MNIEQAKKHIRDILYENNTVRHSDMVVFEQEKEALCIAIKSLDMWDKVIKELEKDYKEYENVLTDLSYSDGVGYALDIIEEHLKEIEE